MGSDADRHLQERSQRLMRTEQRAIQLHDEVRAKDAQIEQLTEQLRLCEVQIANLEREAQRWRLLAWKLHTRPGFWHELKDGIADVLCNHRGGWERDEWKLLKSTGVPATEPPGGA